MQIKDIKKTFLLLLILIGIIIASFFVSFLSDLWKISNGHCIRPDIVAFSMKLENVKNNKVVKTALDNQDAADLFFVESVYNRPAISNAQYFWSDADERESIYESKKNIYVNKSINSFRINVLPYASCYSDTPFKLQQKDVLIYANGRKYPYDFNGIIVYNGIDNQELVLEMSWRKKFKTKWNILIQWIDSEEFTKLKTKNN